jgi:POT family proton-dependent oligopeptide transporter
MSKADASRSPEPLTDEARHGYRTTPEQTTKMPSGIPYIVGNEAAERFSFYGMKAILMVFMTGHLYMGIGSDGRPVYGMNRADANFYFHLFEASAYAFPLIGAFCADYLWGKYRTIIWLSLVYCLGHFALALDETRLGLLVGLSLIAVGTGGIKPCVSAHVGDQFGPQNKHLLERVYGWFYFSINFGSMFSTLLVPAILARRGVFNEWIPAHHSSAAYAFGLPGVLMGVATLVFWLGRRKYAHIPAGGKAFLSDVTGSLGKFTLRRLAPLYFFILFFWTLYDQTGSSWVQQLQRLNCHMFGYDFLPAQVQAVNPLLVMIYIPLFNFVLYPAINKVFLLTPLRKIGIGMSLTAAAFGISWYIETLVAPTTPIVVAELQAMGVAGDTAEIEKLVVNGKVDKLAERLPKESVVVDDQLKLKDQAEREKVEVAQRQGRITQVLSKHGPSALWQVLAYIVITAGEVMVSITGLEYSYSQAPHKMKSFVMSLYLLTVSLGNVVTALINKLLADANGNMAIPYTQYYAIFTGLMIATTVVYAFCSRTFREQSYYQGDEPAAKPEA